MRYYAYYVGRAEKRIMQSLIKDVFRRKKVFLLGIKNIKYLHKLFILDLIKLAPPESFPKRLDMYFKICFNSTAFYL